MIISLFILQLIKDILLFCFHCLTLTVFNLKKIDISVMHSKLFRKISNDIALIGINLMLKQILKRVLKLNKLITKKHIAR